MNTQTEASMSFPDGSATTPRGLVVTVRDTPESSRFEAWVGDELVGYAGYRKTDGTVVVLSTVTEGAWRGQGIASTLTRAMFDVIRAAGWQVGPRCPFTADYLAQHDEQLDLVAERYRSLVKRAFRPGE